MRLRGLQGGEFSFSGCSFFRNSGGSRMSMGRDIRLLTSCGNQHRQQARVQESDFSYGSEGAAFRAQLPPARGSSLHLAADATPIQNVSARRDCHECFPCEANGRVRVLLGGTVTSLMGPCGD